MGQPPAVAVVGSTGYLGAAVCVRVPAHTDLITISRRSTEHDLSKARGRDLILACHGALRTAAEPELVEANVLYTRELLDHVDSGASLVYASSRFARVANDPYGLTKRSAERLIASSQLNGLSIRFGVLVGPSPSGLGNSFLTRMVRDALEHGLIRVPTVARTVRPIDVRTAADAMWLMSACRDLNPVIDAVAPATTTDDLCELIAVRCEAIAGVTPKLVRTLMPESSSPPQGAETPWQEACSAVRLRPRPLQSTIDDTVAASLSESMWDR